MARDGGGRCSGGEKGRGLMGWVDPDWNGVGGRMEKSLGSVYPERQEDGPCLTWRELGVSFPLLLLPS